LLKFDGSKEKEKEEIIDYLQKNFIYGSFGHTKPADLKRKEKKVEKKYNEKDHTFYEAQVLPTVDKFIETMIGENRVQELHTFYHNQVKYTNL